MLVSGSSRASFGAHSALLLVATMLAIAALGCASGGIEKRRQYVSEREVERPPVLFVYDFATSKADVVVDEEGFGDAPEEMPEEERQARAREVANVLAETIVADLRERGIEAEHATHAMEPPLHALLLKGEFRSIDEGDQMARVTVGFGAGKSEVRIVMHLFQQMDRGARLLATADAEAEGGKMPGILVPVGAGAALGSAARSAVISGTMSGLRELKGPLGKDLKRIAGEFGERAEALYDRHGWR
jgi:hypothetical protein